MSQTSDELNQQNIPNNNQTPDKTIEEGKASDYSRLKPEDLRNKLKSIENYILFISHASQGHNGTLPLEKILSSL